MIILEIMEAQIDWLLDHPKVMETEYNVPPNPEHTHTHDLLEKGCGKEEPKTKNMMKSGK